MPNDDTRLFPSLSWSKFNSDFRIPDSDDAARVANEVRASVDGWIQTSLSQLEDDMNKRAQVAIAQLNTHITASNAELVNIQGQIDQVRAGLAALAVANPALVGGISALQAQTDAARTAMQQAADDWKANGANAVSTVESILGTVAKVAAA